MPPDRAGCGHLVSSQCSGYVYGISARSLKPPEGGTRRKRCMGTLTGALPLPAMLAPHQRSRVHNQNSQGGVRVQRAQAGEETAVRESVEPYRSKVFSTVHRIARQRNGVEDIAQQVFAKVYFSLKDFDFGSSL